MGGVDILAHVMGGSATPGGGFVALTDEHWLSELNLNLLATVRLDRLDPADDRERGTGAVVHVTSIQSVLPARGHDGIRQRQGCAQDLQQIDFKRTGSEGRA